MHGIIVVLNYFTTACSFESYPGVLCHAVAQAGRVGSQMGSQIGSQIGSQTGTQLARCTTSRAAGPEKMVCSS